VMIECMCVFVAVVRITKISPPPLNFTKLLVLIQEMCRISCDVQTLFLSAKQEHSVL
jgi:hypothetical protein